MADMTIAKFISYTKPCASGGAALAIREASGQTMKDAWNKSVNGVWLLWVLKTIVKVDENNYETYRKARTKVRDYKANAGKFQKRRNNNVEMTGEETRAGNTLLLQMANEIRAIVANPFIF